MRARRVAFVLGACVAALVAFSLAGASVGRGAPPAPRVAATQSPGSFTLVSTSETNPDTNLTLNAASRTAHVDAGLVTWDETWTIPEAITPGKSSSVTLGLNVVNNGPTPGPGQYDVAMKVLAPGLTQQLIIDISSTLSAQKTYTWTVPDVSPTTRELFVTIQPYESASATYRYERTGTPTGGGGTGGPPAAIPLAVAPPAPQFGSTVSVTAAAGGVGVAESPELGNTTTVSVTESGTPPDDPVVVGWLNEYNQARHGCYIQAVQTVVTLNKFFQVSRGHTVQTAEQQLADQNTIGAVVVATLRYCLALVDSVLNPAVAKPSVVASAACPLTSLVINRRPGGAPMSIGTVRIGRTNDLTASCTRSARGITIGLATTGGVPLSRFVGPRLQIGVVRRRADPGPATARVTFNNASPVSAQPNWSGSWNTTFGTMRLTQTGATVTGTYAYCNGSATINGQVTGSTLSGTWNQPCNSKNGRIRFVLSSDGNSFTGAWGYGTATPTRPWNGSRA